MGWELLSKREIENSLAAIWTATVTTSRLAPMTHGTAHYLDGYRVAVGTVGQALGVDAPVMRLPDTPVNVVIIDNDTRSELAEVRAECERLRAELEQARAAIPARVDPDAIRAEAESVLLDALDGRALDDAAAEFIRIIGKLVISEGVK